MTDAADLARFGDFTDEDAYCDGDPDLDQLDWDAVSRLQAEIDALPPQGSIERQNAVLRLQERLSGDSDG